MANKRIVLNAYHSTTVEQADGIKAKGFKLGKQGRFGGGIYLFLNKEQAISYSKTNKVLEAIVLDIDIYKTDYSDLKQLFKDKEISWEEEEGIPELKDWALENGYNGCLIHYEDGSSELVVYFKELVALKEEYSQSDIKMMNFIANREIGIEFIKNTLWNKQVKLLVARFLPEYIKHVKPLGVFASRVAIKGSWSNLRHVSKQTESLCWLALKQSPKALQFVKEQSLEMCDYAVKKDPLLLRFANEQTEKMCLEAMKKNCMCFLDVIDKTLPICEIAVEKNPYYLYFAPIQTEELCKKAVQKNGLSIREVHQQTEELCKLAVEQNWKSIEFCKFKTPEICMLAFEQSSEACQYF